MATKWIAGALSNPSERWAWGRADEHYVSSPLTLRRWQQQATEAFTKKKPTDFLVAATPGSGKTSFALHITRMLLDARAIDRVVFVAPTDHLRTQWWEKAHAAGVGVEKDLSRLSGSSGVGYVTTYAQLARSPAAHRRRVESRRTLVVLDEIHHAGDGLSWGDAVGEAFAPASHRLLLTGTPFRSKAEERIPFVTYEETDEGLLCLPDFEYSYRDALADKVVRPVVFAAYRGQTRWMTSAGDVISATLGSSLSKRSEQSAWRTALHPKGKWLPHVIAAADARLTDMRDAGVPDAGGLLLARDQEHARACVRIVQDVTGTKPTLVLSDDPRSSKRIAEFARGDSRWLVAVRQVSEGVDVPRLCVAVWATTYRTPLFFAQAVGRVLRSRSRHEVATVFLPAVKPLLALAAEMESERNRVITPRVPPAGMSSMDDLQRDPVPTEDSSSQSSTITALGAEAEFAQVLHAGAVVEASSDFLEWEDEGQLAIPGLMSPQRTAQLLAARDTDFRASDGSGSMIAVESLRKEIHSNVQSLAFRTRRSPAEVYRTLHAAVPGPPSRIAPREVLECRRDWLLSRLYS